MLGLEQGPDSKAVIHKAYRKAAKTWHPDRFEREPGKRKEAEAVFKQIQAAYSELLAHLKSPVEWPVPVDPFAENRRVEEAPAISFGGAPGCFVTPDFSMRAVEIIMRRVGEGDRAIAIVDLTGPASQPGTLSQYILLTLHGIFVRDKRNLFSLLWYDDLGDIVLASKRRGLGFDFWQRFKAGISGRQSQFTLEIHRRNGTRFFAIADEADDSVKKVIYNFLQQRKSQLHR
jgi:hypothetical protein